MAERTLTSANSSFALQITGLFPVPVNIKGYATADMFSTAAVDTSQTMMGADGVFSAGWVPKERPFTFHLQGDSESNDIMDAWIAAEENSREKLPANGIVILSGNGRKYAMTRGFLGEHTPMSDAKDVLQPRSYTIKFQSISPAPV